MTLSSVDLRQRFLSFFERNGHKVVKSSPLLPANDPTLFFVNAGMVQFKDVFTGKETRPYKRATSSQKCVRASGKHNDLENVGRTTRHCTFFEMLGNFSFGDYFKREACVYAWDFLTKDLGLDPKRLSVTIFGGEGSLPKDEEAYVIWRDIVGVPEDRIESKGMADNFWSMGDTGPCGPCTEIHYDRGPNHKSFTMDESEIEGDRVIEIWNLVFMQYERKADGSMVPLPAPSVDTGMGLERLCSVVNGVPSNYDTDLMKPFVDFTAKLSHKTYHQSSSDDDVSLRVVADHCRSTAFLIADGIFPSNEGRGYALRRIMRRAIRHGARLGFKEPFFHLVCDEVVKHFGDIYPELKEARAIIERVVRQEEETFRKTMERGLALFDTTVKTLKRGETLDGAVVFRLYETFGFPPDLTTVLAQERGIQIDWQRFESAKAAHEKASASELGLVGIADVFKEIREKIGPTHFIGESHNKGEGKVLVLLKDGIATQTLSEGDEGAVILDQTPFYGESGGQVGDTGLLTTGHMKAEVLDTKKIVDLHVHQVRLLAGQIKVGERVQASIDTQRREDIRRHHSVTHLLHAALRQVLGDHVSQKGSLVAPDRLRFDFSHFEPMSEAEVQRVEDLVNDWVLSNSDAHAEVTSFDKAKTLGAMALFGEKYGDEVRVVKMGPHSTELCGGTHVHRTGDIGPFRILSESALSAGIRRLEAVAGRIALNLMRKEQRSLKSISKQLQTAPAAIEDRLAVLLKDMELTKASLEAELAKNVRAHAADASKKAKDVKGIQLLVERMKDGTEPKNMRDYADALRDQLKSGAVVLACATSPDKCTILVSVSKDLSARLNAGTLAAALAHMIDGRGGGKPDFAQAGGPRVELIDSMLKSTETLVANSLKAAN